MFNKDSLMGVLRERFPLTFETWDGYQTTIVANDRDGLEPIILVGLYNSPTESSPANLHRAFLLNVADDAIDSGDYKLVEAVMRKIYPEAYSISEDTQITE